MIPGIEETRVMLRFVFAWFLAFLVFTPAWVEMFTAA